jgi:hypothetical protein
MRHPYTMSDLMAGLCPQCREVKEAHPYVFGSMCHDCAAPLLQEAVAEIERGLNVRVKRTEDQP